MLYTDIAQFYDQTDGFQAGDIGLAFNPHQAIVGKIILAHQNWIAPDRKSGYSHAFLITGRHGCTFESGIKEKGKFLLRIGTQNIFEAYEGYNVQVIRHSHMTEKKFWEVFPKFTEEFNGKIYPYHRLPFYFIPPVARRIKVRNPVVCSELVALFYSRIKAGGFPMMRFFLGVYPDYLADMGHHVYGQKRFTTIFQGVMGNPFANADTLPLAPC